MSNYSNKERLIAKFLEKMPWLRDIVRWSYKRFIFLKHKRKGFQFQVSESYELKSPYQLVDKPEQEKEILFFGYYDKSPWNPSMTKLVFHSLTGNKGIDIKVFDLVTNEISIVGTSSTWNYQQGAMVQWLSDQKLIYNDQLESNNLGSKVYDLATQESFAIEMPIQCVSPCGNKGIGLNYRRLMWLRPDYGYSQKFSNFEMDMAADQDGLWTIDLSTGKFKLFISLSELKKIQPTKEMQKCEHKVNHVMYSPDGTKIIFMHRWLGSVGKWSRLYVYDFVTLTLEILLDEKMVSHYSWRNNKEVIAWSRHKEKDGYFLIEVDSKNVQHIDDGIFDKFGDGHPTFNLKDTDHFITDTYPDKSRVRHLLKASLAQGFEEIGQFFSSWNYENEERCDLHPRWSPDGKLLSIDSAHTGVRKTFVLCPLEEK